MAIAKRTPLFIHTLLLAGAISLAACGGSSGGGDKPKTPDTTPNPITFSASTNADVSAVVESAPVTIGGIDAAAPVSITGGEYSINGGAFTSAVGTISNGQTLRVRITASDNTNTPKEATVTVGGVSAKFIVTTAPDVTPDVFNFNAKTEADVGTEYSSDAITVNGIDIAVPVSITGGLYSINGGEFTSAAGTVSSGQTITVKTTSGNSTETSNSVVLTIGGVSGIFTVTTVGDTNPPVAEFKFPTPYTMSEANTVTVRGTAIDDHVITDVKLVVRSFNLATPDVIISTKEVPAVPKPGVGDVKDFSSWTATIPLTANAENEIKVVATDDRDNSVKINEANKIVIRQSPVASAFPDENNPFKDPTGGMVLDQHGGRERILIADNSSDEILSVSISTGQRTVFKYFNNELINEYINSIGGLVIDETGDVPFLYAHELFKNKILKINLNDGTTLNSYYSDLITTPKVLLLDEVDNSKKLLMVNDGGFYRKSEIISFDLKTEEFSVLSPTLNSLLSPTVLSDTLGIALDKSKNRYLITFRSQDSKLNGIYSVDRANYEVKPFSTNEIGSGDSFVARASLEEIVVDEKNHELYVIDSTSATIFGVSLATGDRRTIADLSYDAVNDEIVHATPLNMYPVLVDQYMYVSDYGRSSLRIVDLITGEKVHLSKPKNAF